MSAQHSVAVLGATGSVGRQALEVLAAFPEKFRVVGLAAGRNLDALEELVARHRPSLAVLAEEGAARLLASHHPETEVHWGRAGLERLASCTEVDTVLAAVVGRAGLEAVLAAARSGKRLALANKEALVMAGGLIQASARESGATLLPVDSEHAAAHQLLSGLPAAAVRRLVLTASGGPFLGLPAEKLRSVSAAEALAHPRWRMGAKISIDSATMMNKGFEVIEAHWLFGLPSERIDILVHPQSIAHAMVETYDGALFCQLADPDMRIPLAYALAYPERLPLGDRLADVRPPVLAGKALEFHPAAETNFPALRLCRQALARGGGVPAALSVADEVLVEAFLQGTVPFHAIVPALEWVCERIEGLPGTNLQEIHRAASLGESLAREACRLICSGQGGLRF